MRFIAAGCFPVSLNAPNFHLSLVLASVVQGDGDISNLSLGVFGLFIWCGNGVAIGNIFF